MFQEKLTGNQIANREAREKYEGKIFPTNKSGNVIVTKYIDSGHVKIKFINTGSVSMVKIGDVRSGLIRDCEATTVQGVGVVGSNDENCSETIEYMYWVTMISRCCSPIFKARRPTYLNATLSENFKYFQYFKDWFYRQIGHDQEGWHLDKDILVKGNKHYSEDTCCFVPAEVNTLILNKKSARGELPIGVRLEKRGEAVKYTARLRKKGNSKHLGTFLTPEEAFYYYKEAKETYIKEVAEKWKDQIDPRVYNALMHWVVEITD